MEEQASDKQIDFMKTLKCSYPDRVTKQQAKEIIKDALERQNGVSVEKHEDFKMYGSKKPTNGHTAMYVSYVKDLVVGGMDLGLAIDVIKKSRDEFS